MFSGLAFVLVLFFQIDQSIHRLTNMSNVDCMMQLTSLFLTKQKLER